MIQQTYEDIVTPELAKGAIINNDFHGFREDYLILHCLLKIHQPKTFLEIGCNMGVGTKIIKNALSKDSQVYSLDLPTELAHISLQHPISEGKGDKVGSRCDLPFTLLRGDSLTFDFGQYPCEGYYIDGEHDTLHAKHETLQVLKCNPKIVAYHDTDIKAVMDGILEALEIAPNAQEYNLFRVVDTRISYLLRKQDA